MLGACRTLLIGICFLAALAAGGASGVRVQAGGDHLSVPGEAREPAQLLQLHVGTVQQTGLDQQFHDVERGIGQPGAKDKALVLGEAVHPLQEPFGVVIPAHQQHRCLWFSRYGWFSRNFRPPSSFAKATADRSRGLRGPRRKEKREVTLSRHDKG